MSATLDKRIFLIVSPIQAKVDQYTDLIQKHVPQATIYTAPDGAHGLTKLQNVPPHVLICDYELPKTPASQIIDEILRSRLQEDLAIIVMDHLPEKERYLDELVTGRIQFVEPDSNDQEITRCLFKALNFMTHGKNAEFYLRFLAIGDELIKEGTKAEFAFIVRRGHLKAYRMVDGQEIILGTIGEGEFAGEMAYINGEARSASVVAMTDCELIEIPFGTLERVLYRRPAWSKTLMMTLTKRLKRSNDVRSIKS